MQALVLVGGEGTRLRPLTETVPKAVMPLAGRPFLSYMVDWLGRHGVEEVVLACGYRADVVRAVLGEGGSPRLRYVEEPEPRGTAGAIKFAAEAATEALGERFLALNGDVLTDLDLTALMRDHERSGARATLGLYPVQDATGYGLVERAGDGAVSQFLEKPKAPGPGEINAGAYVLERSVLDLIPAEGLVSIERDVFPLLIGEGLKALPLPGYWMDIGTPDRYLQATWDILERRVRTDLGDRLDEEGRLVAQGARIDPGATLEGPALIGEGTTVGADAAVGPRVAIGSHCEIGREAAVSSTVLLGGCKVGERASVRGTIAAADAEFGAGASLTDGVVGAGERVEA